MSTFVSTVGELQDLFPNLKYLQLPKWEWRWKLRPFVGSVVEPWPGYFTNQTQYVILPKLFEDALIARGWTRVELECYWRFYPPTTVEA